MQRSIESALLDWKNQPEHRPLLIRGPRQVGKSYVVEKFGASHFDHCMVVNFEFQPEYSYCFETLDPTQIIKRLELLSGEPLNPGSSLLFLDEIQQCPQAIQALRYFKEKMPRLHVIGAGSFLEFVIHDDKFQEPVGRVQSLFLRPCSFYEFLNAIEEKPLVHFLKAVSVHEGIPTELHNKLLAHLKNYFMLGGLPEIIQTFIQTQSFQPCLQLQDMLLEYYRRDFSKYKQRLNTDVLEKIFMKAPGLIAKRFKYSDVAPDIAARTQKPALAALIKAGIIHPVYHTNASSLPLQTQMNEKKFKLLMLDLGLAVRAMRLNADTFLHASLSLSNQGALAEQFVGQELLAYAKFHHEKPLFYWRREKSGSMAEVDYITHVGPQIVPIEVKAGKTGRLRSLQVFLEEKKLPLGVRTAFHPLKLEHNILSVPLYMTAEIPRLIRG